MKRQPTRRKQREARHHQQQEHVEVPNLTTLAVKDPVGVGILPQTRHCRGHAKGRRQADNHGASLLDGRRTQSIVGRAKRKDGLVVALGGSKNRCIGGIGGGIGSSCVAALVLAVITGLVGQPGLHCRGGTSALGHLECRDDTAIAIDHSKSILQRDLVLLQHLEDSLTALARRQNSGTAWGSLCSIARRTAGPFSRLLLTGRG